MKKKTIIITEKVRKKRKRNGTERNVLFIVFNWEFFPFLLLLNFYFIQISIVSFLFSSSNEFINAKPFYQTIIMMTASLYFPHFASKTNLLLKCRFFYRHPIHRANIREKPCLKGKKVGAIPLEGFCVTLLRCDATREIKRTIFQ